MTFTLDTDDFERAAKVLDEPMFRRITGRIIPGAIRKSANAVRKHVRAQIRPRRRTGRLASNVRIYHSGSGLAFQSKVRSTGPVAHLIAGGVKAHAIEPGKVMPIHGPGRNPAVVGFATAVQHPGFRPDPYFARGVRESQRDIDAIIEQANDQTAEELAFRIDRKG